MVGLGDGQVRQGHHHRGNLDSGVWPESKSFGEGEMGPIPDDWKGICQNEHDASFHCNKSVHLTDFAVRSTDFW